MGKKTKQPGQPAAQEFQHAPFKALRGLSVPEAKTPLSPAPVKPTAPPADRDDEARLFLRAMADVAPLDAAHRRPAREPSPSADKGRTPAIEPTPVLLDDGERRLFLQAMQGMTVRFRDGLPVPASLPAAAPSRLKQLKRGSIRLDLELDLHGLGREEALQNLERFITGAWQRGQQAVLVITGKGLNSPGEPVLQGAVSAWLREQGKDRVVEFAPAPRELGGSGAFVVFLRQRPTSRRREEE